jgi:hypothetical protein
MDQEPKQHNFDWSEKYLKHLSGQEDPAASPAMASFMTQHDLFLPDALTQFQESDLDRLFQVADLVNREAQGNGFYLLYGQLIRKMTALVLEQFPEKFETLTEDRKDRVFGAKIQFPTEQELYKKLYVYLLGKADLSLDMMFTGSSLRDLLQRLMTNNPEIIDQRTIDLIGTMDDQYSAYYTNFLRDY